MKVDKSKKRLIIKMVTSVIIVVAGLFQKQMETEDERSQREEDYMF